MPRVETGPVLQQQPTSPPKKENLVMWLLARGPVVCTILVALALGLAASGCNQPKGFSGYPVFWQADRDLGPGFYVFVTASPAVQEAETNSMPPQKESWNVNLFICNHTGTRVLLARIVDHGVGYSLDFGQAKRTGSAFRIQAGGVRVFEELATTPFAAGECQDDAGVFVKFSIPWYLWAEAADLEVRVPFIYYSHGASYEIRSYVTKRLRVSKDGVKAVPSPSGSLAEGQVDCY